MEAKLKIDAEIREDAGKGSARAARRVKKIPAIVYSKDSKPVSITLPENVLNKAYFNGGFMSSIVEITAGKEKMFALPREVQTHPVKDNIMHVDFMAVNDKSEVRVMIPVRFLNRERCKGLKRGGALNVVRYDLELLCKPQDIPSHVEVDLLKINIGDSVHLSHIELPDGVTSAIKDRDFTIAAVVGRGKKEEEETTAAEGAEVSVEVPAITAKAEDDKAE